MDTRKVLAMHIQLTNPFSCRVLYDLRGTLYVRKNTILVQYKVKVSQFDQLYIKGINIYDIK